MDKMQVHCKFDVMVKVGELKPHPKNRNIHPKDQIERLAKILAYQGVRAPIVVSEQSGKIVKGHGTLLAIKANGWPEAPVVSQSFVDDEQEYAFVQSDNAIASWADLDLSGINLDLGELGPEFDIDLLGIKGFTIDKIDNEEEQDPDSPPVDVETRAQLGDVWKLGDHRLLCGDATNPDHVNELLGKATIDMVFTDPPYGIEHSGKGIKGATKGNDYGSIEGDDDVSTAIDAFNLTSTMFPEATLIFWGANYYCSALPNGFGWLVWDKDREGNTFSGAELAFVNKGVRLDMFKHRWHGMIKGSEHGQARVHPTQKPVALAEWCFENYGDPRVVLDLFGGSGSTLMACEKTKRCCYMMELDPKYCDAILSRWEKFTGKTAELETRPLA